MVNPRSSSTPAKLELANRLFFRLYQCANMLHKTGSRAVEEEGLTTQQWAVLGALSRDKAEGGMSIGDLARYLMVSRQNLSGLIGRMERDGHVAVAADGRDRRSRVVRDDRLRPSCLAGAGAAEDPCLLRADPGRLLGQRRHAHAALPAEDAARTCSGWMPSGTARRMVPRFKCRQPLEGREYLIQGACQRGTCRASIQATVVDFDGAPRRSRESRLRECRQGRRAPLRLTCRP